MSDYLFSSKNREMEMDMKIKKAFTTSSVSEELFKKHGNLIDSIIDSIEKERNLKNDNELKKQEETDDTGNIDIEKIKEIEEFDSIKETDKIEEPDEIEETEGVEYLEELLKKRNKLIIF